MGRKPGGSGFCPFLEKERLGSQPLPSPLSLYRGQAGRGPRGRAAPLKGGCQAVPTLRSWLVLADSGSALDSWVAALCQDGLGLRKGAAPAPPTPSPPASPWTLVSPLASLQGHRWSRACPREAGASCPIWIEPRQLRSRPRSCCQDSVLVAGLGAGGHATCRPHSTYPSQPLLWALFLDLFVLGRKALDSLVGLAYSVGVPDACEPRPVSCSPSLPCLQTSGWPAGSGRPLSSAASVSLAVYTEIVSSLGGDLVPSLG